MKITLEKALILFPVVTTTYIHKDTDTNDENVAILTLSQDPLLVVSVNVSKSRVLKSCPYYDPFGIDTTTHEDKGYTLSCTGMLSHIQPLNKLPNCGYTFFCISVEEDDVITFDQTTLDSKTKQLVKTLSYSIYTVRSKVADYQGLQWQSLQEVDENDASNEDSTSTESQEVYELDDDSTTTEEENNTQVIDKHDTQPMTCFDDDDDFQQPIIIVRPARIMNSDEKKSKKARFKRSRKDDDDDDFQLSTKRSRLYPPPGTRKRRSSHM